MLFARRLRCVLQHYKRGKFEYHRAVSCLAFAFPCSINATYDDGSTYTCGIDFEFEPYLGVYEQMITRNQLTRNCFSLSPSTVLPEPLGREKELWGHW